MADDGDPGGAAMNVSVCVRIRPLNRRERERDSRRVLHAVRQQAEGEDATDNEHKSQQQQLLRVESPAGQIGGDWEGSFDEVSFSPEFDVSF